MSKEVEEYFVKLSKQEGSHLTKEGIERRLQIIRKEKPVLYYRGNNKTT